jgi:GntR family transcriptional regulator
VFGINTRSPVPIYAQLKARVAELVAAGVLRPDEGLPSVRALAGELGINPNTVQRAYTELEREGIIYQLPGRGSFVSAEPGLRATIANRQMEELVVALRKAQMAGVTQQMAHEAVDKVYEEEEAHD